MNTDSTATAKRRLLTTKESRKGKEFAKRFMAIKNRYSYYDGAYVGTMFKIKRPVVRMNYYGFPGRAAE